jgi:membrane protein YdbS with pleckstrin-like domain
VVDPIAAVSINEHIDIDTNQLRPSIKSSNAGLSSKSTPARSPFPPTVVSWTWALVVIVLPDIIAYVAIHLRYDTTWYVLSSRSLRIRRGVWVIHETTLTFENIQNVSVDSGPLEQWFGIANVMVDTAGGGLSKDKEGKPMTNLSIAASSKALRMRKRSETLC